MDCLFFSAAQGPGRKDSDVGVSVGVCGMQIAPHFLDEDTGRTPYISHGRIQEANHEALIIAAPAQSYRFADFEARFTMRVRCDQKRPDSLL